MENGVIKPVGKSTDFHLNSAADVEIKEPEWLVPGYVPRYGITTIAGEGGVGKTSPHCRDVHMAISNERLTAFGLVSMLGYYTERCVTC